MQQYQKHQGTKAKRKERPKHKTKSERNTLCQMPNANAPMPNATMQKNASIIHPSVRPFVSAPLTLAAAVVVMVVQYLHATHGHAQKKKTLLVAETKEKGRAQPQSATKARKKNDEKMMPRHATPRHGYQVPPTTSANSNNNKRATIVR